MVWDHQTPVQIRVAPSTFFQNHAMKRLKNLSIIAVSMAVLGGSALLGLNSCSDPNIINIKSGSGKVYNISYSKGRSRLHELAKTAKKEDAWLYVNEKWYDVGYSEEETQTYLAADSITRLLKEDQGEAILTHIHPHSTEYQIFPPAPFDIASHAQLKKEARKNPKIEFKSEVYDGYGVWRYDTTESIESKIEGAGGGVYAFFGLPHQVEKLRKRILEDNSLSRKERIERYIEASKELGIILTYTLIESFKK